MGDQFDIEAIRADIASGTWGSKKVCFTQEGGRIPIEDGVPLPGPVIHISPERSVNPAFVMLAVAIRDGADAETRGEALMALARIAVLGKHLHNLSLYREVKAHDCPHCQGPAPEEIDIEAFSRASDPV